MSNKHTPTPWVKDEESDGRGFWTIRRADGSANGDIEAPEIATVYTERDADLTVRAVNSHEALVKALEGTCAAFEMFLASARGETDITDQQLATVINETIDIAQAALALAQGAQS